MRGYVDATNCAPTLQHLIRTQPAQTGTVANSTLTTPTGPSTGSVQQGRLGGFLNGGAQLTAAWIYQPTLYATSLANGYPSGASLSPVLGGLGQPSYATPYSDSADSPGAVLEAQGRYLVNAQQASLAGEWVRQSRIDTRRRMFDEMLYERRDAPTWEDDRERLQGEELRRSRLDPPQNEIVSGRALNALLDHLQKLDGQGGPGPDITLDEDVVSRINVTSGRGGHVGLLKNGGRLHWPLALTDDGLREDRQQLASLMSEALATVSSRPVDVDAIDQMQRTADRLQQQLSRRARNLPPAQYVEAKRFLADLDEAIKALQRPDAAAYVTRKCAPHGQTVAEIVRSMTQQGLHFAPAVAGDEAAYLALHRALSSYESTAQARTQR
jgi:hypothetical protein